MLIPQRALWVTVCSDALILCGDVRDAEAVIDCVDEEMMLLRCVEQLWTNCRRAQVLSRPLQMMCGAALPLADGQSLSSSLTGSLCRNTSVITVLW